MGSWSSGKKKRVLLSWNYYRIWIEKMRGTKIHPPVTVGRFPDRYSNRRPSPIGQWNTQCSAKITWRCNFDSSIRGPLNIETIGCPERSVKNCHYSLLYSAEEHRCLLGVCKASLKKLTKKVGLFEPGTSEVQIRNVAPWGTPPSNYGAQQAPTGRLTCIEDVADPIGDQCYKHCNLEAGYCRLFHRAVVPKVWSADSLWSADQFPGDAWKHFCISYLQVNLFF